MKKEYLRQCRRDFEARGRRGHESQVKRYECRTTKKGFVYTILALMTSKDLRPIRNLAGMVESFPLIALSPKRLKFSAT